MLYLSVLAYYIRWIPYTRIQISTHIVNGTQIIKYHYTRTQVIK